jgi:hypothetical protein
VKSNREGELAATLLGGLHEVFTEFCVVVVVDVVVVSLEICCGVKLEGGSARIGFSTLSSSLEGVVKAYGAIEVEGLVGVVETLEVEGARSFSSSSLERSSSLEGESSLCLAILIEAVVCAMFATLHPFFKKCPSLNLAKQVVRNVSDAICFYSYWRLIRMPHIRRRSFM